MKKIINISIIIATALVFILTALYAVEMAFVLLLTMALIGLFALPIKLTWAAQMEEKEEKMIKKINIISLIISAVIIFIFCAIIDLETTFTLFLTFILIGMTALLIGGTWNGVVEIAAEIERRRELKKKQKRN